MDGLNEACRQLTGLLKGNGQKCLINRFFVIAYSCTFGVKREMSFRDERNGISRRPTRNFSMAYMAFFLGLLEKGVCLWIIIHVVYGYAFFVGDSQRNIPILAQDLTQNS